MFSRLILMPGRIRKSRKQRTLQWKMAGGKMKSDALSSSFFHQPFLRRR
jgi:hypothetical protein